MLLASLIRIIQVETLRSKFPKVINALYVAEQIHEKDLSVLSMPTYRYTHIHTHKIIGEYSFSFYKYDVHVLSYIARLSLDTISIRHDVYDHEKVEPKCSYITTLLDPPRINFKIRCSTTCPNEIIIYCFFCW